ncbi:hypothetical protein [Pseudonocardia oceani]|uniref:hypothetical protein n=1 Tax=Pseudonocardia oceani TaxID=2792013 RepID=UPI001C49D291|nr:hypothetical protein [Pseudonocardia oceani]
MSTQSCGVSRFPRYPTLDGVRWNTITCFAVFASSGTTWTAVAPVPMIPTRLSARPVIGRSKAPPV